MKRMLFAMLITIAASSFALPQDSRPIPPIGPIGPPRGSYPSPLPIVFVSNRDGNTEIYRMNPDGSATRRLTYKDPAQDRDPRLSPDGRRIAFSTNRDGNYEIYVMNVDGSSPIRISDSAGWNYQPDR